MIKITIDDLWINHPRFRRPENHDLPEVERVHTVGWVISYGGKEYGDFVTVAGEKKLSRAMLEECASIFTEQANDTMISVVGEEWVKMTESDWRGFALSGKVELSKNVGISIQKPI